jgi:hypothetical protein
MKKPIILNIVNATFHIFIRNHSPCQNHFIKTHKDYQKIAGGSLYQMNYGVCAYLLVNPKASLGINDHTKGDLKSVME